MSKKFIQYLSLAGTTVALAAMGTFSKPAVAGDAICDSSTEIPTLILGQQRPMPLNPKFFNSKQDALQQCHEAASVLNADPSYTVLVAETLESGVPVICVRPNLKARCDGFGRAVNLLSLKEDTNPEDALRDMLRLEDENLVRTSLGLFMPWNLLNPWK